MEVTFKLSILGRSKSRGFFYYVGKNTQQNVLFVHFIKKLKITSVGTKPSTSLHSTCGRQRDVQCTIGKITKSYSEEMFFCILKRKQRLNTFNLIMYNANTL